MSQKQIGVIVGSLRKGSFTGMMAHALQELSPPSLKISNIEIGAMPHYNQDLETDSPPASWTQFRKQVLASNGILFITPEYNRGVPGVLKNAVDVGSRPWGKSVWAGKPGAVISMSPGALGGIAANHHLRQTLVGVGLATMAHPEAYLPAVGGMFDESGKLKSAETREFITAFMRAFEAWINKNG